MGSRTAQKGFTLVELMVTSVLSGFLILGAFSLYIAHRQNYSFHESQQANLENGRFVSLIMSDAIGKAAYKRQVLGQNPSFIFSALDGVFSSDDLSPCNQFKNGEKDGGIFALDADDRRINDWSADTNPLPRQICVRYQPRSSQELDCLGNPMETQDQLADQEKEENDNGGVYDLGQDQTTVEVIVERYWYDTDQNAPGLKCAAGHLLVDTAKLNNGEVDSRQVQVLKEYPSQELISGNGTGLADLRFELVPPDTSGTTANAGGDSNTTLVQAALVRTFALFRASTGGPNDRVREYGTIDGDGDPLADWAAALGGADKAAGERLDLIKSQDRLGADPKQPGGHYLYRVVQNNIAPRNL